MLNADGGRHCTMSLRVNDLDEAMAVAKAMCSRHPHLIRTVGSTSSARDVALKIFLQEVASENSRVFDASALNTSSIPRAADTSAMIAESESARSPSCVPGGKSNDQHCAYCDEFTTRFCKNTGRRHETQEQRAVRLWKHIYRQFHVASNFISTARLEKKNTCVEDYAVDLNLDDI
jgi:hypothetical protein